MRAGCLVGGQVVQQQPDQDEPQPSYSHPPHTPAASTSAFAICTPLPFRVGHVKVISTLLSAGVRAGMRDEDGKTHPDELTPAQCAEVERAVAEKQQAKEGGGSSRACVGSGEGSSRGPRTWRTCGPLMQPC